MRQAQCERSVLLWPRVQTLCTREVVPRCRRMQRRRKEGGRKGSDERFFTRSFYLMCARATPLMIPQFDRAGKVNTKLPLRAVWSQYSTCRCVAGAHSFAAVSRFLIIAHHIVIDCCTTCQVHMACRGIHALLTSSELSHKP